MMSRRSSSSSSQVITTPPLSSSHATLSAEEWLSGLHLWRRRASAERHGLWEPARHELRLIRRWMREQREDYQRFQRGEASLLYKEGFDVLTEYGFDWEAEEEEVEDMDEEEEEDEEEEDDEEENDVDDIPYYGERGDLLEEDALQHTAQDSTDDVWENQYRSLLKFREQNGHLFVPVRDEKFPKLYRWMQTQRERYRIMVDPQKKSHRSPLTNEQYNKLAVVGFVFDRDMAKEKREQFRVKHSSWASRQQDQLERDEEYGDTNNHEHTYRADEQWEQHYKDLVAYHKQNGHTFVSNRDKKFPKLYRFAQQQRERYLLMVDPQKKSHRSPLTDEQYNKLSALGFVFDRNEARNMSEQMAAGAQPEAAGKRPRAATRKAAVAAAQTERDAGDQTSRFVSPKQYSVYEEQWEIQYNELVAFHREHGHTFVPVKDNNYRKIDAFIRAQRDRYLVMVDPRLRKKFGRTPLSNEQFEKLSRLGFVFDKELAKKTRQQVLSKKQSKVIPDEEVSKVKTARASNGQQSHLPRKLSILYEEQWEKMYGDLAAFHRENGHTFVNAKKSPKLHNWTRQQRDRYVAMVDPLVRKTSSRSPLTSEQYVKLSSLGFVFDKDLAKEMRSQQVGTHPPATPREEPQTSAAHARFAEKWNRNYEDLKAYHARHGHINLPKEHKLSKFLVNQRPRYVAMVNNNANSTRQDRPLTKEEYEKLSALGVSFGATKSPNAAQSPTQRKRSSAETIATESRSAKKARRAHVRNFDGKSK